MIRSLLILFLTFLVFTQSESSVQVSGNVMYTYSNGKAQQLNDNTNSDNPFNTLRTKLFFFSEIDENIEIDVEIMYDGDANMDHMFWMHGASIKFLEVSGNSNFNIKLGRIPLNIGQFPKRVDETLNGLIGVPLVYSYQTLVDWEQVWDPSSQGILRKNRNEYGIIDKKTFPTASPIAYESCWNTGLEFFGNLTDFEYSIQFSNESITNPKKFDSDDLQISSRIGYSFSEWLNLGFSGAKNRYLSSDNNLIGNQSIKDYYHTIFGIDGTIELQTIKLFGELYKSTWDANLFKDEKLETLTGFGEINYLPPFSNKFELVGRFDFMQFKKISFANDSKFWWDSNFIRYEAGFKYGINTSTIIKTVYQYWDFDQYTNSGLFSTQLIVAF